MLNLMPFEKREPWSQTILNLVAGDEATVSRWRMEIGWGKERVERGQRPEILRRWKGGREREVCRSVGVDLGVKVKIRTEEGECVRAHFEGGIKW